MSAWTCWISVSPLCGAGTAKDHIADLGSRQFKVDSLISRRLTRESTPNWRDTCLSVRGQSPYGHAATWSDATRTSIHEPSTPSGSGVPARSNESNVPPTSRTAPTVFGEAQPTPKDGAVIPDSTMKSCTI